LPSKIRDPKRFSEHFRVPHERLSARGALDPFLNVDTRLFIDPLLLERSAHAEMQAAHVDWLAHFTEIIRLLNATKALDDAPWRAVKRRFRSPEFKGTCLGYGAGSIVGSGIGPKLGSRLLATAHEIVKLGVQDPNLFPLLALFEEDVGLDRISDLTTNVIGPRLAEFTARVLDDTAIRKAVFEISGKRYSLPVNPFVTDRGKPLPVVLVPTDVLSELPIATDWDDIDTVVTRNAEYRARLNKAIGDIWGRFSRRSKRENRDIFLANREAFEALLAAVNKIKKRPYDVEGDPQGMLAWLELGQAAAAANPVNLALLQQTPAGVREVVAKIVEQYKQTVERQGLWKSLYDSNDKPLHESYAQRLFFAMALSYCKANNLAISPETNSGGGPVDFVVSQGFDAKVIVELKLSTNTRLRHGYETQLEVYKDAEETPNALFVVLDVDGGSNSQIEDALKMETDARNAGRYPSEVVIIDAKRKKSASKR
jgi:hypothetical protein